MKLRYYLRGLGIGILVTVAILSLTGGREATLTDAQIRERALELGMVDSDSLVLSEIRKDDPKDERQENMEDGETKQAADMETQEPENTETQEPENTETEPVEESTEKSEEKTTEQFTDPYVEEPSEEWSTQTTPEDSQEDTWPSIEKDFGAVSFEIRSGAGSYSVSRELEEAGLVADAKAFDNYLCNSGYSKAIRVGTYEIVPGTDEEEIAKIITGKR